MRLMNYQVSAVIVATLQLCVCIEKKVERKSFAENKREQQLLYNHIQSTNYNQWIRDVVLYEETLVNHCSVCFSFKYNPRTSHMNNKSLAFDGHG